MSALYNFEAKGRIPVSPLSYDFKDLSKPREIIVDYINGDVYVHTDNGDIVNICASNNTMKIFAEYLKANPDTITSIIIKTPDGKEDTVEATFERFYEILEEINNKTYLYAGSHSDGGSAISADKLIHSLSIIEDDASYKFDGSSDIKIDLTKYYKSTGGPITGDITLRDKLYLTENYMYGTELPATGKEGQLFFLIVD